MSIDSFNFSIIKETIRMSNFAGFTRKKNLDCLFSWIWVKISIGEPTEKWVLNHGSIRKLKY